MVGHWQVIGRFAVSVCWYYNRLQFSVFPLLLFVFAILTSLVPVVQWILQLLVLRRRSPLRLLQQAPCEAVQRAA